MTPFDRIEQRLPDLLTDLAAAQQPDYFDNMLGRTARTRQRSAWSALERWLPMGVTAQRVLVPPLPWRSIGILVILGLLVAAGALIYVGSRPRVPEPFGPARNGKILFSTIAGDIYSVDPLTGTSKAIVTGPAKDFVPTFSRDGTSFMFLRNVTGETGVDALFVANADGSGVRKLTEGQTDLSQFEWSPSGVQAAVTFMLNGKRTLSILNTDGSDSNALDLDMDVFDVSWRPNGSELVFRGERTENGSNTIDYSKTNGFYRVKADGTGLRAILPATKLDTDWMTPALAPDGSRIAYARWEPKLEGRIHVLDLDSGIDRRVEFDGTDGPELTPRFSPDGTQLLLERYVRGGPDYQLVVVPVDGGGPAIAIGPRKPELSDGAAAAFSPDGTKVLATYWSDKTTWLLNAKGGPGSEVSWPAGPFPNSWQRLAP